MFNALTLETILIYPLNILKFFLFFFLPNRAVLDALLEVLILPPPEQKENLDPSTSTPHDSPPALKPPSPATARLLNFVSFLVSQASFKIPMMHAMRGRLV